MRLLLRRSWEGFVLATCVVALLASPASAQTPSPRPPEVDGEVTGSVAAGGSLELRWDATAPAGWESLHLVEAVVLVDGRERERLTYDVEDVHLTVGAQRVVAGTGGAAGGTVLRVRGADVVLTTGGAHLSLAVVAEVTTALPEDARFELRVVSDLGEEASVVRGLDEPADEGLTWETVLALVAGALFVGAFVGNLLASRRRPPLRPSVYATVQRRLDEERTAREAPR